MMRRPASEQGAALLAVLLLVAVMGAIAASALEKLRLSTALAINGAATDQARAFASGIESLAALRIDDLVAQSPERTTLDGGWNGRSRRLPLPSGGVAFAKIRDGGNCFNLNSVGQAGTADQLASRQAGIDQFAGLMVLLGVPSTDASRIAAASADWVDSDSAEGRGGAEDRAYAGRAQDYRAGNTLFADVSELRAVSGVTPEIYVRMKPWLCALPTTDLSPINVNTLLPEQAPLLAMIAPEQLKLDAARAAIAARPRGGWGNLSDFYRLPMLEALLLPLDVQRQPQVRTRWFRADLRIVLGGAELEEDALIDARIAPARVVTRRWGSDE